MKKAELELYTNYLISTFGAPWGYRWWWIVILAMTE